MLFDESIFADFPDRMFRRALSDTRNLRDIMALIVPDLAARLDFARARELKPDFMLGDWRRRECDLLAEVPLLGEGGPVMLCLLMEHQSRPDPVMPLRMPLYAFLYWDQQWKEYEHRHPVGEGLRLTPVLPIVFHTGPTAWTSNRTLGDLFAGPAELRELAPVWPVRFWDLSAQVPEALIGADGPFARMLAVLRGQHESPERFRALFEEVLRSLDRLALDDRMRWRDIVGMMWSWVFQRLPADRRDDLRGVLLANQPDESLRRETADMTQILQETMAQRQAREIEARLGPEIDARSRREELRETLSALLASRFGSVTPEQAEAIAACQDIDRLRAAILRVYRVPDAASFTL